jgi:sphinganine C4-monooxygenase
MNSTLCASSSLVDDCAPPLRTPWYYTSRPDAVPGVSDHMLSVVGPVVAYWALSALFHLFDVSHWAWLERYRLHESAEVAARNRASRSDVLLAVLFQQAVQMALGWWWLDEKAPPTKLEHIEKMGEMTPLVRSLLGYVLSPKAAAAHEADAVYYVYWWAIPVTQMLFAMFIIDTWQYFWHRGMHMNKWAYKHFHSWHHRLYVPYAYGALYNHPLEGFILDSLGAALAEAASFMSVRQATLLFVVSTLKTVDDHCGYKLPFDPIQWFTTNDADYHDIHHQIIGIKSNFSQPFFVHWDVLLGTRMTREDIAKRKRVD